MTYRWWWSDSLVAAGQLAPWERSIPSVLNKAVNSPRLGASEGVVSSSTWL